MGCSESQPVQDKDAIETEAIVTSERNGPQQPEPAKADVGTENSLQEVNSVQLNSIHEHVKGPEGTSTLKRPSRRSSEMENAWGVVKVNKNLENAFTNPQVPEVEDLESEYGKDGVDLASSHVQSGQDTDRLLGSSLGARTSPDGTYRGDYTERMNNQRPSIRKVNILSMN